MKRREKSSGRPRRRTPASSCPTGSTPCTRSAFDRRSANSRFGGPHRGSQESRRPAFLAADVYLVVEGETRGDIWLHANGEFAPELREVDGTMVPHDFISFLQSLDVLN